MKNNIVKIEHKNRNSMLGVYWCNDNILKWNIKDFKFKKCGVQL